jgi:hypothetical protein
MTTWLAADHGLQWLTRCGTSSVNDDAGGDNGVSSCRFVVLCCCRIGVASCGFQWCFSARVELSIQPANVNS